MDTRHKGGITAEICMASQGLVGLGRACSGQPCLRPAAKLKSS